MPEKIDFWKLAPVLSAIVMAVNALIQLDGYLDKSRAAEVNQIDSLSEDAITAAQDNIDYYQHVMSAGKGVLQVNGRLSTSAWGVFSEAQLADVSAHGLQYFGYIEPITSNDLYRYVSKIRRYEINGFHIYPLTFSNPKYIVKLSHESDPLLNIRPGFDVSSVNAIKNLLTHSDVHGKLYISESFQIDTEISNEHFLAFAMPITLQDEGDGISQKSGWMFSVAKRDKVFAGMVELEKKGIDYEVVNTRLDSSLMESGFKQESKNEDKNKSFGTDYVAYDLRWRKSIDGDFSYVERPQIIGLIASTVVGILLTIVAWLFSRIYGRTAKELNSTQKRFATAVEAIRDGLIDWENMDEDAQYWSDVVWEKLGLQSSGANGSYEHFLNAVHPEQRTKLDKSLRDAQENPGEIVEEFQLMTENGGYRWHRFKAKTMLEGGAVRLIARLSDEHERKILEQLQVTLVEKLTASNEELERFAFVASHDLQEPLRQVRSFSELANMEVGDVTEHKRLKTFLDVISESSTHMQALIVDLLDYAKPADEDELLEYIGANETLEEALANLKERLDSTGAVIEVAELPMVMAHSMRLGRVFQNIIANSLKYVESGVVPRISISNECGEEFNTIKISDNGIGMEAVHIPKIFEPFKRLVTRSEYSGTGMGLSICKRIIESYDGRIWAESTLGEGTRFYIQLPIAEPGADSESEDCNQSDTEVKAA